MTKVLRLFPIFLGIISLLSSCGSESNDNNHFITSQPFNDLFSVVDDRVDGVRAFYNNMGYIIELDYTDLTADVTISGLKLTDGTAYPTMILRDLPWKINSEGWSVITASNVKPEITGFGDIPTFTSFELSLINRTIDVSSIPDLVTGGSESKAFLPGICAKFTLNSRYSILSSMPIQYVFGKLTSATTGTSYENKSVAYVVTLNSDTRTFSILLKGARFIGAMPAMDIVFDNIPFNVVGTSFTFDVDKLIPKIGNDPFPSFPITNLKGSYDFASGLKMQFECTPATMGGLKFNVNVDADYRQAPE